MLRRPLRRRYTLTYIALWHVGCPRTKGCYSLVVHRWRGNYQPHATHARSLQSLRQAFPMSVPTHNAPVTALPIDHDLFSAVGPRLGTTASPATWTLPCPCPDAALASTHAAGQWCRAGADWRVCQARART